MYFIKHESSSDLPDIDSSPVGRLALFFDVQCVALLIELPPTTIIFVVGFFANPLVISGHELDNYPAACLPPIVFTVSTHDNKSLCDLINTTSAEEIHRSERNGLAVCARR